VEYLTEMEVNCRVNVQIQDVCSDTILNHYSSQKLKLIRNDEFNLKDINRDPLLVFLLV
jgi:hypothetical protein